MHNAARYAIGAFAGAAIISGVGIGVAMAGDSESSGSELPALTQPKLAQENPADGFLARLAAKLGIDEQTLRDAIEETLGEEVQRAEDEGYVSPELADRIQRHIENGSWTDPLGPGGLFDWLPAPLWGGDPDESPLELLPEVADLENEIAAFIGATEEELREALEDGQTLGEVAEDFGTSPEDLQQFMLERALEIINDEQVPEEVRDLLRSGLNQLIEMYINGEVAIGDFLEEAFGEP